MAINCTRAAIRGDQVHSVGHQRHSDGNWQSDAITSTEFRQLAIRRHQRQSDAITSTEFRQLAIRRHQRQSDAITSTEFRRLGA